MSVAGCRAAWAAAAENCRASALDGAFPGCACEPFSLRQNGGTGLADEEKVARVLTSPDGYDTSIGALIATKLQHTNSHGLSVIRQGADDREILDTVHRLMTGQQEAKMLVGAVLVPTSIIRSLADPDRWYGIYATDEETLEHHVDILATTPKGGTKARKRIERQRRYALKAHLEQHIIFSADPTNLLQLLRQAGL